MLPGYENAEKAILQGKGTEGGMKEKVIERIKMLDSQIDVLMKERVSARQELANLSTEIQMGDRVKIDPDETGTVYQITSIHPGYNPSRPDHYGAKIKKDGTPGERISRIYLWGSSKLVKLA